MNVFFRFCLLLLLAPAALVAQDRAWQPITVLPLRARWVAADKLQQLYVVLDDYRLQKYSSDGRLLYEYGENNYGPITYIDVSNPLMVLVYYDDYVTAVLLDRTLSPMHRIDLMAAGLRQSSALAVSNDNMLWIYDPAAQSLRKLDAQGNTVLETPYVNFLLERRGVYFVPEFLLEAHNTLYLSDPEQGILLFDNLGNYKNILNIKDLTNFQVWKDRLFYFRQGELFALSLDFLETRRIALPASAQKETLLQAVVAPERLALRFADRVEWYK